MLEVFLHDIVNARQFGSQNQLILDEFHLAVLVSEGLLLCRLVILDDIHDLSVEFLPLKLLVLGFVSRDCDPFDWKG